MANQYDVLGKAPGLEELNELSPKDASTIDVSLLNSKCDQAMNDDLNTPIVLSYLFDAVKIINSTKEGKYDLSLADIEDLKALFTKYTIDIFGLCNSEAEKTVSDIDGLMSLILDIRVQLKQNKDWSTADKIRDGLNNLSIEIKDTKDGATWKYSN